MAVDNGDRVHYRWRRMTDDERKAVLLDRQRYGKPWHSPPHFSSDSGTYLVSAACYEHQPVIGHSPERMLEFSAALVGTCHENQWPLYAWIVLPNHYHLLSRTGDVKSMIGILGRLHGRTSYNWNLEDQISKRKVWFNAVETGIKSERHFWATLIYVMNNAVKHRYVERWQDWLYSNATDWLDSVGRDEAVRIWREFPIDDYGQDWDPPDL